ncbi:MAG: OmpA family protein [Halarcobacter sp.]
MDAEKKVIFLFLLLILLVISCVYFNAQDIYDKQVATTNTKENIVDETRIETQNTEVGVKDIAKHEAELTTEPIDEALKNNQEENAQETQEEFDTKEESIGTESSDTIIQESKKPDIKEIEPLVKLDKEKYVRVGNEKYIQDMSIQAQELQLKINEIVAKNPIIFKRASADILRKSEKTVDTIARLLKKHNNISIEIAGHTDAAGADDLNKRVSMQRAEKIKELIASYGIPENKLIARGYGEDIPLVENNKNGYSLINRRVEFNIIEE